MNICWEILGIEPTTDLECIRQAYLALLPSFHPESDPQGFKRLRQAYEEAQHWAASPAEDAKRKRWATNMKYWWRSGIAGIRARSLSALGMAEIYSAIEPVFNG